jgi:hypothetical protein
MGIAENGFALQGCYKLFGQGWAGIANHGTILLYCFSDNLSFSK